MSFFCKKVVKFPQAFTIATKTGIRFVHAWYLITKQYSIADDSNVPIDYTYNNNLLFDKNTALVISRLIFKCIESLATYVPSINIVSMGWDSANSLIRFGKYSKQILHPVMSAIRVWLYSGRCELGNWKPSFHCSFSIADTTTK